MSIKEPTNAHEAAMDDLKAVLKKHEHLDAIDMLALASQLVGNLIAFQDQRKVTSAQAMEVVSRNIEIGNQVAIQTYLGDTVGSA